MKNHLDIYGDGHGFRDTWQKEKTMKDNEYELIGKSCRDAVDGNLLIGSFAAELIGESYPFSKAMCAVVFEKFSDIDLGKKFVVWLRENDK